MINRVRTFISADKQRYTIGNYDLDLTYITDRIIGFFFYFEFLNYRFFLFKISNGLSCRWNGKYLS